MVEKNLLSDIEQTTLEWFYKELTNKDVSFRLLGEYISHDLLCYYVDHKLIVEKGQESNEYMCIYTYREIIDKKYPNVEEVQIGPIKDVLNAALEFDAAGVCVNDEVAISIKGCKRLLLEAERCIQIKRCAEESTALNKAGIVLEFFEDRIHEFPKTDVYTNMIIDNLKTCLDPDKVSWFLLTERKLSYYDLVHVQRIIEEMEELKDKDGILHEIERQKSLYI